MTSIGQATGSDVRDEFWRGVGQVGARRRPVGDRDEAASWPTGSAYVHITTPHSGILATDGLSAAPVDEGGQPPLGLEIYVEGRELIPTVEGEGRWLVTALEEAAGALAAAGADQVAQVLADHALLSLELSAGEAPEDWVSDGRLGALIGVELPGRPQQLGQHARALALTPLRPSELAVVTREGAAGRRRVAEALAGQGWYSYADSLRPAVL